MQGINCIVEFTLLGLLDRISSQDAIKPLMVPYISWRLIVWGTENEGV